MMIGGFVFTVSQSFWMFGCLLEYLLEMFIIERFGWRILTIIFLIPILIVCLLIPVKLMLRNVLVKRIDFVFIVCP